MKSLNPSWKVCLVAIGSFTLGAWLSHTRAVKAQDGYPARDAQTSHISITSVFMSGRSVRNDVVDGAIVGFSCVSDTTNPSGLTGNGVCYVATQWGNQNTK
jgi:hypothetical protein